MPFTPVTMAVCLPSSGCIESTTPGSECAFNVMMTTSCTPSSRGSDVQRAGACKLHAHQAAYRPRSEDADLHDAAPVTLRSRLPMPRVAGHDGGSLIEH